MNSNIGKNSDPALNAVRNYWDSYVTNLQIPGHQWGSAGFFKEIKKSHDPAYALSTKLLDLPSFKDKSILEVGCGMGLDVVEYARHGARVTAIDLSPRSVELTGRYLNHCGLEAAVQAADAEELPFEDETFDLVVARGVLMYTPQPRRAIDEIHRVLRPGGEMLAILHNRHSWFAILAMTSGTHLYDETQDPPINRLHTRRQARRLFGDFDRLRITHEKFPAPTGRRHGFFAGVYNALFVPLTAILPGALIKPLGYYLILQGVKPSAQGAESSPG